MIEALQSKAIIQVDGGISLKTYGRRLKQEPAAL